MTPEIRVRTVRTALICALIILAVAEGIRGQEAPSALADSAEDLALSGERLEWARGAFEEECALCHGVDGNAEQERLNLIDGHWLHGGTLPEIEHTIAEGVPDTLMKPMKHNYGAEQIADLAKYVKRLRAGGPSSIPETVRPPETVSSYPPPEELLGLHLHPQSPTLRGTGAAQRFVVIGSYRDGIERDVTEACSLWLGDPQHARIEGLGRITAVAEGEAVLHAELGAHHARTTIHVENAESPPPFSFQRRIGAILTRRGCNAADCHGGVKGRGGLKLALGALYPRDDHEWIVQGGGYQVLTAEAKGERIPRINVEQPEQSLLLLKPTFQVEHEGGKRFEVDSEDYRTILEWVRAGAPFDEPGAEGSAIERLEVFPREAVLTGDGRHRIVVTARLADGRSEDVTDQVSFKSNNPAVVKEIDDGAVQAVGVGETDVVIRAAGARATARFGVIERLLVDYPDVPRNNFIDEYVFAKLRKFHVAPSELTGDSDFLRRICLDLTGTLPPTPRVREFLADPDPQKREKLIDVLLETPEYEDYWTFRFAEFLRVGYGGGGGAGNPESYAAWLRDGIANNKPYDQMARDRIAAQGTHGPASFYPFNMRIPVMVAEDARVFLGRRLDCAQCHNHPSESWSQNQFWGLGAFYGRMTHMEYGFLFDDPAGKEYDYGEEGKEELEFKKVTHPRTGERVKPTFLDGSSLPQERTDDPRRAFAEWITAHPYFAEATVNRVWGALFHRGIVDPVDDFDSVNLPSHPELLAALARDFREHGHDLKRLIRTIVNSRAYQLSSRPNRTNRRDELNFSHARPRALLPEVLLDAVASVTGIPVTFDRSVGRAIGGDRGRTPPGTRAVQLVDSFNWPSQFLEAYGRISRNIVAVRDDQPNLARALHMVVGDTYTEHLAAPGGRIDRLMKQGASNREIAEELYLAALSRLPSEKEREAMAQYFRSTSTMLDDPFFGRNQTRRKLLEDLAWGLICSKEFAYNH